eukprot:scaffold3740_cov322-Prasinococcus_capsulatus_cf.AAC.18
MRGCGRHTYLGAPSGGRQSGCGGPSTAHCGTHICSPQPKGAGAARPRRRATAEVMRYAVRCSAGPRRRARPGAC